MTPEQMQLCSEGGRFWWMRPDGTFYGSDNRDETDIYLLDASPEWVAQWPDWATAAAAMTSEFERLDELRD